MTTELSQAERFLVSAEHSGTSHPIRVRVRVTVSLVLVKDLDDSTRRALRHVMVLNLTLYHLTGDGVMIWLQRIPMIDTALIITLITLITPNNPNNPNNP